MQLPVILSPKEFNRSVDGLFAEFGEWLVFGDLVDEIFKINEIRLYNDVDFSKSTRVGIGWRGRERECTRRQ